MISFANLAFGQSAHIFFAVLTFSCNKSTSEYSSSVNQYESLVSQYVGTINDMVIQIKSIKDQESADKVTKNIGKHSRKAKSLSREIHLLDKYYKKYHRDIYDKMQDKMLRASQDLVEQIVRISDQPYGEDFHQKSNVF